MKPKLKPPREILSGFMFVYFLLITFSVYVLKPAKDSLFLEYLGTEKLPYAFLFTAILMGLAVAVNSRLVQRMNRPLYLSLSLGFFSAGNLVFWVLVNRQSPRPAIFFLLYCWGDILLVTAVTQFWIFVNDLFYPREAKKRIGFFVSGGLLGGVGGSLVALFRPGGIQTEGLILAGPAALVLCILIILLVSRLSVRKTTTEAAPKPEQSQDRAGFFQSLSLIRSHRYLLLLSGMIVTAIVVSNLVDFQFKWVAKLFYPDKNDMTSFFALFHLVILVFSYFFTVLMTTRILKKFGIRVALLILPLLLLVASVSLFFIPQAGLIIWAVVIKGSDKSLSHSLAQSVRELLYIPIPEDIKYKAKVFIDMFLNKFADGLAGLLLIAVSPFFRLNLREVSLLAIVFVVLWVVLNFRIHREYINIIKTNIPIKWRDAGKLITDKIDLDMTKLVFDTLQSRERSSVLYAMNCFDLIKKEKMSPEMQKLISLKANELQARSMGCLLDVPGEDMVPEFDDKLDVETLDTQIKEIMSLDVYQELMRPQIEKATRDQRPAGEIGRMEAAKVLGLMNPDLPLTRNLKKLLEDKSPEVVRYAAESAGRLRNRDFVPHLVRLLAQQAVQEEARRALIAYGELIVGTLKDWLSDPEEDIQIRRAIPGILAQAGSQRAADLLTIELGKGSTGVEAEIIEALHRLKSSQAPIQFSEKTVLTKIVALIKKCYLLYLEIQDLRADKKREILAGEIESHLSRTLKEIFELLGLIYPQDDITRAYQNILAGTKKGLEYSVELLDNILRKEVKDLLLPLLEDSPFEDKVKLSRMMIKVAERTDFS
jgi:AAA family ATP:ADP antiporter